MKSLVLKYLLVLTISQYCSEIISANSFPDSIKFASFSINEVLNPEDSQKADTDLFFEEQGSLPIEFCEIAYSIVIPIPVSGNTRFKCLNRYNLQITVYLNVNSSLLIKSIIRDATVNNITTLLTVLQV